MTLASKEIDFLGFKFELKDHSDQEVETFDESGQENTIFDSKAAQNLRGAKEEYQEFSAEFV